MKNNIKSFDVIIIGSGPAGNTAGIYLIRSGFSVAMFTGVELGGQITTTPEVENYPAFQKIEGLELMNLMLKQSENLGVNIFYDNINKVDFSKQPYICYTDNGEEFSAKNIIIATGASAKYLEIPSERKFIGKGVSTCATCDGNFFKNKIVSVIGGGRTATIEALHLSRLTSKVYIIYRKDTFNKIEKDIMDKIYSSKNIEILFNYEVIEILGETKVNGVKIKNNKTNEEKILDLEGVFIAIGRTPKTEIFKNTELKLDQNGYIITNADGCRTNIKNVYACGDVNNKKVKQVIVAAAHGCIASLEIQDDENI